MSYGFRPGARISNITPEAAATELARIEREAGRLTPEAVLTAAEPAISPLHSAFEWDDSKAGKEFRLVQARTLIRAVVTIDEEPERPTRQIYVHVSREEGYQAVETVIRRPDLYEQALTQLQRKFDAAEAALLDLRKVGEEEGQEPNRLAAIGLAVQGFATVREALAVLAR